MATHETTDGCKLPVGFIRRCPAIQQQWKCQLKWQQTVVMRFQSFVRHCMHAEAILLAFDHYKTVTKGKLLVLSVR